MGGDYKAVPAELKERRQFIVWRREMVDGEEGKVPYNPRTGARASSIDADTWMTFEEAVAGVAKWKMDGPGFMFSPDDHYTGIDLDDCRDPKTGIIADWAKRFILLFSSYTEISPSGTGVKIWIRGKKPGDRCRRGLIECYDQTRFFAVTGMVLTEISYKGEVRPLNITIENRQQELNEFYVEIFEEETAPPVAIDEPARERIRKVSDDDLLRRAMRNEKFRRLWEGDFSDYPSQSEGDEALCVRLAFWTGRDAERIDRLFRQSKLMREKWNRDSYRQPTIERAIEFQKQVWSPIEDFNDLFNAHLLVEQFGDDIRYLYELGQWLDFDGRRWLRDAGAAIENRAKQVVRSLYLLAADDPRYRKWAARSGDDGRQRHMISQAQSLVPIGRKQLDNDPWLFNVANGTLDLRTGKLQPHRREDFLTRISPVVYDPEAKCPRFERFLREIFNDNRRLADYLQRAVGYTLTGEVYERAIFLLHGEGHNGKTTLLEVLLKLFGDYAAKARFQDFTKKYGDEADANQAIRRLEGMRFVYASEPQEQKALNEALLKEIAGNETLAARFMYKPIQEFMPQFKLFLAFNQKPTVHETTNAVWDRFNLLPFEVRFEGKKREPHLAKKLMQELPGILAWAVTGCLLWQKKGLEPPEEVVAATREYRSEMDWVSQFVADCFVKDPRETLDKTEGFAAYEMWARNNGMHYRVSKIELGRRLSAHGFVGKKDHWKGWKLQPMWELFKDRDNTGK